MFYIFKCKNKQISLQFYRVFRLCIANSKSFAITMGVFCNRSNIICLVFQKNKYALIVSHIFAGFCLRHQVYGTKELTVINHRTLQHLNKLSSLKKHKLSFLIQTMCVFLCASTLYYFTSKCICKKGIHGRTVCILKFRYHIFYGSISVFFCSFYSITLST